MESLPQRFGKYHVLARIAQGGMAEVYKVKTVGIAGFEKIQALKRIHPSAARDARFIRSFIDEARIAVELNHRNIVQVFDFGKAGGELYLAMELIEGKDLRSALSESERHGLRPPMPVASYVIAEVAAGLDYAHRKADIQGQPLGIVHCDVSPANVMLSHEGFVKILDFGVARASFASSPEAEKRLRGKPRYMAPEQTRGDAPGPAADVFALATVAWELLAGRPLFDGPDLPSILAAVRRAEVPPLEHVNVAVPAALSAAVSRALAIDPARRGTAAELATAAARASDGAGARALASWLSHLELAPPPPPVRERSITEALDEGTGDTAVSMRVWRPRPTDWGDEPSAHARGGGGTFVEELSIGGEPTTGAGGAEPTALHGGPRPRLHDDLDPPTTRPPWRSPTAPLEDIDDDLGAPEVALLRERRRAVVVAVVLEGGAGDARHALARTLAELAYKRGGVLLAVDGDGAVVAFGLEIAGEDDVATAVAFAVDAAGMSREVRAAGAARGDLPVLRIGARAGVIVQPDAGGRHRIPPDAIDDARGLARDAQPGRPLLAGGAGRLSAAHFAFREVPSRRRLHRRVRVFEVLGPRSFDERDRALLARRGRFVGRAAALAELDARLDAVIAGGTQQRVLVLGPVGVGKSRLVAEFVARALARSAPPLLVATAATPATTPLPFGLIVDLVQRWLGLPPGRGRDARAQLAGRLAHVLGRTAADRELATDAVAAIDAAMELRDGAALVEVGELPGRVAAALEMLRVHLPGGRPQIVVIEDLHLADAPSLDVLRTARADRATELLLATCRPDADALPRFEAVITLGDLVGAELRELVIDRLGEAATPLAVAAVIARAGGNTLFVEELATAVREQGEHAVPATARDVIAARVDRLSAPAKNVLQYAAVAGGSARARILEELVGIGDLSEPLEELCAEGLLVRADDASPEAGEGDLAFARGLVREVVYDSLSAGARRDAHARVGKLLASRHFAGREEPPAVIAEHLEGGDELAGAAAFWLRAGRLALAADDADGALGYFDRTLALEARLGAGPPSAPSQARRREAEAGRTAARRLRGEP